MDDSYIKKASIKGHIFIPGQICRINTCRELLESITLTNISADDGEIIQEHTINLIEDIGRHSQ